MGGVSKGIFPAERNAYMVRIVTQFNPQTFLQRLPSGPANLHGLLKRETIFIHDRPVEKSISARNTVLGRKPPMAIGFTIECFLPTRQRHQDREWKVDGTLKFAGPSRDEKSHGRIVDVFGKRNQKVGDVEFACVFWRIHPPAANRADAAGRQFPKEIRRSMWKDDRFLTSRV